MNENMILNFGGSGGGAALNFKVVGNPQPETAKENTIWVNTDVPIGAWYFVATQPENLNEGDVWFPTGTSSSVEFNALKKNGIQVYPLSAKQMVSGSLVDVEAKTHRNGEWVDWAFHLLSDGTFASGYEFEPYSGGAVVASDGAVIFKVTAVEFGTIFCKQQIDVTNYRTAKISVNGGAVNEGKIHFGFTDTKSAQSSSRPASSVFNKAYTAFAAGTGTTILATEQAIDLTSLTGKLWLGCAIAGSGMVSSTEYGRGGISAVDIIFE